MNRTQFRWGIIGLGSIAKSFANGLKESPGATLAAVGSRSKDKADAFAAEFGASRAYGSYAEVAADPEIDAVYIATPHTEHAAGAKLCIEHDKPALVEKPFTVNSDQARAVIALARERGVFLMEAMWSRYFPIMGRLRELIADGKIGAPRMLQADFGFRGGFNPKSRLFDPSLGGGALLDVGIYPISLATMIFGTPDRVTGLATLGETKVDEISAMLLGYPTGALAVLSTGIRLNTSQDAVLLGESGSIRIHSPWWRPSRMTVKVDGQPDEVIELPYPGNGYQFEADEVRRCVLAGERESPLIPLDETLVMVGIMDELRRQWGVKYPFET